MEKDDYNLHRTSKSQSQAQLVSLSSPSSLRDRLPGSPDKGPTALRLTDLINLILSTLLYHQFAHEQGMTAVLFELLRTYESSISTLRLYLLGLIKAVDRQVSQKGASGELNESQLLNFTELAEAYARFVVFSPEHWNSVKTIQFRVDEKGGLEDTCLITLVNAAVTKVDASWVANRIDGKDEIAEKVRSKISRLLKQEIGFWGGLAKFSKDFPSAPSNPEDCKQAGKFLKDILQIRPHFRNAIKSIKMCRFLTLNKSGDFSVSPLSPASPENTPGQPSLFRRPIVRPLVFDELYEQPDGLESTVRA